MLRKVWFVGVMMILACFNVSAETSMHLGLKELSQLADRVVVAECTQQESFWERNKVFTRASFSVTETLKGDGEASVDVLTIGGTALHPILKAPITMSVGEGVEFKVGQQSILFIKKDETGRNRLVGLNQGKLDVRTDEDGARHVPSAERKLVSKRFEAGRLVESEAMTLEETLTRIRGYIHEQ